jgi:hypothetical protein
MTWTVGDTGRRVGGCSLVTPYGTQCESSAVHRKSVTVVLTRPTTNQPVMQTLAAIDSHSGGFSERSFRALCLAAFHDYPKPLSSAHFDVADD